MTYATIVGNFKYRDEKLSLKTTVNTLSLVFAPRMVGKI